MTEKQAREAAARRDSKVIGGYVGDDGSRVVVVERAHPNFVIFGLVVFVMLAVGLVGVFIVSRVNGEQVALGKCVFRTLDYGRRYNNIGRPPEKPVVGSNGRDLDPLGGLRPTVNIENVDLSSCQKYLSPLPGERAGTTTTTKGASP